MTHLGLRLDLPFPGQQVRVAGSRHPACLVCLNNTERRTAGSEAGNWSRWSDFGGVGAIGMSCVPGRAFAWPAERQAGLVINDDNAPFCKGVRRVWRSGGGRSDSAWWWLTVAELTEETR